MFACEDANVPPPISPRYPSKYVFDRPDFPAEADFLWIRNGSMLAGGVNLALVLAFPSGWLSTGCEVLPSPDRFHGWFKSCLLDTV